MKYIQKTWVRILVSLLAGGIVAEIIHISTGDPNRPRPGESYLVLIVAFIVFFILSAMVNRQKN
jgi:hypothetical protein